MIADNITRQKARNSTYTAAKGTYDTAVKAYNAKVKDWNAQKAKKPDPIGDFFKPPKKIVLPKRPNMPTVPAAYSGPELQAYPLYSAVSSSYTATYLGTFGSATTTKTAANKFSVSGAHGGWGSWTMGFLNAALWPVHRSYGVFGYGKTSLAVDQSLSFVQNPE